MKAHSTIPDSAVDRRVALRVVDEHCKLIGEVEDAQSDIRNALIDAGPGALEDAPARGRWVVFAYESAQERHAAAVSDYIELCLRRGELDGELDRLHEMISSAILERDGAKAAHESARWSATT